MKTLLIALILMVSQMAQAKTELECLHLEAKVTKRSIEDITSILMTCNIKLMEGDRIYLSNEFKASRMKLYPRFNDDGVPEDMGEVEKARRIFEHAECTNVAYLHSLFLKSCMKNTMNLTEKDVQNEKPFVIEWHLYDTPRLFAKPSPAL